MSGLNLDESSRLYDAYRFTADDCVTIEALVEEIVQRHSSVARLGGMRFVAYEAGIWCGECDPADPDDDCCVLPERIRFELDEAGA